MLFTSQSLLGLPTSLELLLIAFLISFSAYNINRKTDTKEDRISYPERTEFLNIYYKHIKIVALAAYITALFIAFSNSLVVGLIILLPLISVSLYSIPWIPAFTTTRLKDIFVVKNATVAVFWAIGVIILPLAYFEKPLTLTSMAVFFYMFLKVFGNSVTLDIRDVTGDTVHNIRTIPIKFGTANTKKILTLINLGSFCVIIVSVLYNLLTVAAYLVSLVVIYTQIYIHFISKTNIRFLTDVLADGEYIVMCLLALLSILV
jgi:4-hydroxybenzoate polyprenyltransferase